MLKRLKSIDAQLQGGTAALVALIVNNKLYVANVGMFETQQSLLEGYPFCAVGMAVEC